MRLIYTNSCEFNGEASSISSDAKKILTVAEEFIEAFAQQVMLAASDIICQLSSIFFCIQFEEWEEKIRAVQAKAAIAAEEESVVSSEAASEPRPAKRGRPKKRSESSGKKVGNRVNCQVIKLLSPSSLFNHCYIGPGGRPRHHRLRGRRRRR